MKSWRTTLGGWTAGISMIIVAIGNLIGQDLTPVANEVVAIIGAVAAIYAWHQSRDDSVTSEGTVAPKGR